MFFSLGFPQPLQAFFVFLSQHIVHDKIQTMTCRKEMPVFKLNGWDSQRHPAVCIAPTVSPVTTHARKFHLRHDSASSQFPIVKTTYIIALKCSFSGFLAYMTTVPKSIIDNGASRHRIDIWLMVLRRLNSSFPGTKDGTELRIG